MEYACAAIERPAFRDLPNAKKTRFLTTEAQGPDLIWLDIDTCIEVVRTCHKWVRCYLSMSGTHDADVDFHVSSASRAFWATKKSFFVTSVSQQRCASDTLRQLLVLSRALVQGIARFIIITYVSLTVNGDVCFVALCLVHRLASMFAMA